MANDHIIEVEGRFIDKITGSADDAAAAIKDIGDEAKKAQKETDKLGKSKVQPKVDADTNKFLTKIRQAEEKARKFGNTKTSKVLQAVDKASTVIDKVVRKTKNIAGKTWQGIVKAKDMATSVLNKVTSLGKTIAGKTWSAVVKIKDMATTPLTKIKNALFSIKTLIGVIATGWAANQLIVNPVQLADNYSSAKISFQTLLGEAQGQKMMDDLDQFAKSTPFDTSNVISQAQKMLAMGWDAGSILTDLDVLGDAAASTGNLNQGLDSIVRAMAQIKTKGKLSTEELNQLAEAGIAAKSMLAEQLGYGTGDAGIAKMTKDLEKGAIGSEKAIAALMAGMQKYDGMMQSVANETASGLWSQITDTFEINIFRKWGQGLQDGAKRGFGTVLDLLDSSEGALESFGETVYEVGKSISNWAADKLADVVDSVKEITGSKEFKNASLGGKVKMLWDGAIGNPLSEWWTNTVVPWWDATVTPWLEKKAGELGKGIGAGLTGGILALLGIDTDDAIADGASIGSSFVDGFLEGFDTSRITAALSSWASENKGSAAVLGLLVGGKAIGGLSSLYGSVKGVMGSAAAMTGLSGVGVNTAIALGAGNLAGGASLGGVALAGLGLGSIAGGVSGGLGVLSGLSDIWKGFKSSGKEATDNYFKGGTKIGMVGTGAAAGAAIGSVIPGVGTAVGGLIGAGIGGLGAMFGGDKLGKTLNNFFTNTLPDAWDKMWDGITDFCTDTIPGAWEWLTEKVSTFFTETVPNKWTEFWDGVGKFFSETIPYAAGYVTGKAYTFFTETLPEKWNSFWTSVGDFFTETIPEWSDNVWNNHIVPFWTVTLPEKWNSFWSAIGDFFTETIPQWADSVWTNNIVPFFSETIPGFFSDLWDSITGFFTESLPSIGSAIWGAIKSFFTETIPSWASSAISSVSSWWGGVKESFSSGFDAGSGKGGKARGGIVGGGSTGLRAFARGGIVGGSTRFIRVNEEAPEMIIPLGSHRRDRALKLWKKTGDLLGVDRFARGGSTGGGSDTFRTREYGAGNEPGGRTVHVEIGGITIELHVDARGSENVAEALKAQISEIAEAVVGRIVDGLESEFENIPVRA